MTQDSSGSTQDAATEARLLLAASEAKRKHQRHRILLVAADEIGRMRQALVEIAGDGCENYTRGDCRSAGRVRGAIYGADQWCSRCIARQAIEVQP